MAAAHSTSMQADPPLSRASSAPTVFSGLFTDIASIPNPCGSEPARDGGGTFNIDASRPTAIASKLSSHSFFGCVHRHRIHPQSLWERACSRWRRHIQYRCKQTHRHREQAQLPQFFRVCSQTSHPSPIPVGAELARDGGGTFNIDASRPTAIASKLSSHSFFGFAHRHRIHPQPLWEPSLLAMAAAHSISMQAGPPPSRASSAPTVFSGVFTDIASIPNPCGSEPARDSALTAAA